MLNRRYFYCKWASLVAQMIKSLPAVWDTQVRYLGQEDTLEKEMATHSSILAWKIPWSEEPGRLQSMRLQRVGHDRATFLYCKCSLSLDNPELISVWKGNICSWCQGQHCCCCLVARSCLTLWDPMDCSLPGSSVRGISQARILEWVAISFSTG